MQLKEWVLLVLPFETPVTGGNVQSFYNQTAKGREAAVPVFPTPTIGTLGLLDDKNKTMGSCFPKCR